MRPRAALRRCQINLADWVAKMAAFIRTGYPHRVPKTDYFPLLALLRRRLSDDEVAAVATASFAYWS